MAISSPFHLVQERLPLDKKNVISVFERFLNPFFVLIQEIFHNLVTFIPVLGHPLTPSLSPPGRGEGEGAQS
jgi:hypothetical protein